MTSKEGGDPGEARPRQIISIGPTAEVPGAGGNPAPLWAPLRLVPISKIKDSK